MNNTTFERKIFSVLKDNMYDRFVSNKKTGILDNRKLHKVNITNKLFKKRMERKGKKYEITILVDGSGSMCDGKHRDANLSVCQLAKSLDKTKLDFQIKLFHSDLVPLKSFKEKVDINKLKDRISEEYDGGDRSLLMHGKTTLYSPHAHKNEYKDIEGNEDNDYSVMAGNFDGYWISTVTKELLKRGGQQIVIVLSDGRPSHDYGDFGIPNTNKKYLEDYPLKEVVAQAIRDGIIFLGIGLHTDIVEHFYPEKNTIVLCDLDDLFGSIIDKLNTLIKRG
jgi:cobalamin biosynthesis protein CobT